MPRFRSVAVPDLSLFGNGALDPFLFGDPQPATWAHGLICSALYYVRCTTIREFRSATTRNSRLPASLALTSLIEGQMRSRQMMQISRRALLQDLLCTCADYGVDCFLSIACARSACRLRVSLALALFRCCQWHEQRQPRGFPLRPST